jgi:hypothetical protein
VFGGDPAVAEVPKTRSKYILRDETMAKFKALEDAFGGGKEKRASAAGRTVEDGKGGGPAPLPKPNAATKQKGRLAKRAPMAAVPEQPKGEGDRMEEEDEEGEEALLEQGGSGVQEKGNGAGEEEENSKDPKKGEETEGEGKGEQEEGEITGDEEMSEDDDSTGESSDTKEVQEEEGDEGESEGDSEGDEQEEETEIKYHDEGIRIADSILAKIASSLDAEGITVEYGKDSTSFHQRLLTEEEKQTRSRAERKHRAEEREKGKETAKEGEEEEDQRREENGKEESRDTQGAGESPTPPRGDNLGVQEGKNDPSKEIEKGKVIEDSKDNRKALQEESRPDIKQVTDNTTQAEAKVKTAITSSENQNSTPQQGKQKDTTKDRGGGEISEGEDPEDGDWKVVKGRKKTKSIKKAKKEAVAIPSKADYFNPKAGNKAKGKKSKADNEARKNAEARVGLSPKKNNVGSVVSAQTTPGKRKGNQTRITAGGMLRSPSNSPSKPINKRQKGKGGGNDNNSGMDSGPDGPAVR